MADLKPWELDYEDQPVPEQRNVFGESREDLQRQMSALRRQRILGNVGEEITSDAEAVANQLQQPVIRLPRIHIDDPRVNVTEGAASFYNKLAEDVEGLTTPTNVGIGATMGLAGPVGLFFRAAVPSVFGVKAATEDLPRAAGEASVVLPNPQATPSEKGAAAAGLVAPAVMTVAGLAPVLPVRGVPETIKPVTEQVTQPERIADASSQRVSEKVDGPVLQPTTEVAKEVSIEKGGPRVYAQTEGGIPKEEVSPATTLENSIRDPNVRANNQQSTEVGLAVKSIGDLDKLAELRDNLYKESRDLLYESQKETDPKKRDELFNKALVLSNKVQLPREAIEVATNTGGWAEETGKTELGERPLDFNKNTNASDWLEKNSKRVGISFEKPKTEATPTPQRPTGKSLQLKQPTAAMGEAGFVNIEPVKEFFDKAASGVKTAFNFTKDVAKEVTNLDPTSDYRKSVLNWSAKLQRSFGEAARIQKDIQSKVKDPVRRDAITNWIQANGDPVQLRQQASGSKDAKLRAGYEAALNLTPEELAIANRVKQQFSALEARGQRYDVLNSHKDNYVNQIWDLGKGPSGGTSGRTLQQKFRFSKARTFPNFFVGEQAGYTPKTKDISKLLPIYMHEMENVIAARELVEEMSNGKASDGRPLVAARGVGVPVEKPSGDKATLVFPKISEAETKDYKVLQNQPALEGWRWTAKDDAGNNIFLKADLALHPEAYNRLKNVLGKSAIKEWYQTPTTKTMAVPKALVKGIDMASSEVKKTMLGVLSPFHQVQEATHAVGHRVNPLWKIPEIDLVRNRDQMDAAQHGLMLQPDRASSEQFMEGFKQSKLISKIPALGPASEFYSDYLFKKYIPGLKFKTYQAILDRNMKVYAKDLASNKVSADDVKILSSEQANTAYGHLNYADMARNPTIQHIAQLGILAPDFFESRIRFAGQAVKGATGLKVGREQLLALATLGLAQATLAYTAAKMAGGEWDAKRPFEMTKDGKRYSMRSIPEDIQKFSEDPRRFLHNRLSILGKAGLQYGSGVNYRGQKFTTGETTKELAQMPIPLMARPLFGIGEQSGWEQLFSAAGLKVSKASPRSDIMERAREWGESSTNPKIKFLFEQRAKESLPDSVYKPVRQAIEVDDKDKIISTVREILAREPDQASREKRMKRLLTDFQPFTENDVKPFATPSKESEKQFVRSLDEQGKAQYRQAIKEQVEQYRKLTAAIYGAPRTPPIPEQYRKTYGQ